MSKKVVIVGASSGIGESLAKHYAANGYMVGLAARRTQLLEELAKALPGKSVLQTMDVGNPEQARQELGQLVEKMGGADIIILNAGTGDLNPDWEREQQIMMVNALGFMALAKWSLDYLVKNGGGKIAGVSSIMSLRGARKANAYAASKAAISSYMQGMRNHVKNKKLPVHIIDIRPGFVATQMTEKNKGMFWVAPPDKAARQIMQAIDRNARVAYVTRRWGLLAPIFRNMPEWIAEKY